MSKDKKTKGNVEDKQTMEKLENHSFNAFKLEQHSFCAFEKEIKKLQCRLLETKDQKQINKILKSLDQLLLDHSKALDPIDTGIKVTRDKAADTAPYKYDILCVNFHYVINEESKSIFQLFFYDNTVGQHKFLDFKPQPAQLNELINTAKNKDLLITAGTICTTRDLRLDQQKSLGEQNVLLAIQKNKEYGTVKGKNSGKKAGDALFSIQCSDKVILSELLASEKLCEQIQKCAEGHAFLTVKDFPPEGSFEFKCYINYEDNYHSELIGNHL